MNVEQLLTVRQMAQEAANSEAFWRKVIARREIPIVRVGRSVRVRRRDFEVFLAKGLRPALRSYRLASVASAQEVTPPEAPGGAR